MKILIVDDDPTFRTLLRKILQGYNLYNYDIAVDGQNALDCFKERLETSEPYDLIFLDITMPKMGGLQAYGQVRELCPRLPVILSSGYTVKEAEHQIISDGQAWFLQKPYTPSDLIEVVEQTLAVESETNS